jgi:hypothetical protein
VAHRAKSAIRGNRETNTGQCLQATHGCVKQGAQDVRARAIEFAPPMTWLFAALWKLPCVQFIDGNGGGPGVRLRRHSR